ncbi:MAG: diacylglycerol kinase family lipid kinase [Actinomycetota bacterium]|nr:diacylglycerol kinase family lipid kinase [Actinomycetota bacterium]
MRALVVVNPRATGVSRHAGDVIARALASELKVDVATTTARGHATQLARDARIDGLDLVVALGGDGTVNEVVNGLLADGPSAAPPALAVLPGGSTNVFARSLGVPRNLLEASGQLLEGAREGRRRSVGLGRADERWFTFCAGLGLDAEVVAAVTRRRAAGARSTPALYLRTALREFFTATERREPQLALERPGQEPIDGLFLGIVANTSPWTYLGPRPVTLCPGTSFDSGLGLFALRTMGTLPVLRHVRQSLRSGGRGPRGRRCLTLHDQRSFTLRARRPVSLQIDGECLGPRKSVCFTAVPWALSVIV